jgi:thiamine-phosphate pyrophosphorylase
MRGRRPLPRVHAVTDAAVLALADVAVRAAALASAGPAVALHARDRDAPAAALAATAARFVALARPPEACVFVNARPDVAAAVGAAGVQLGSSDLGVADARRLVPHGWIGRSVHGLEEATAARDEGADFILVGPVYETASHLGHPAAGVRLIESCSALGLPVIAIGGISAERGGELARAGAYGVAAIRGLWFAADPARAVGDYLQALA